jgi:hypothetical protein
MEDPLLASDTPWITTTLPLLGADDVAWRDAVFGGETLFAPAERDGETIVLAWDALDVPPRELRRVAGRCALYPSPDGHWLALEVASLTDGTAALELIAVASGEVRTLCTSPCAIRFGGTSGIVTWSCDGRRFSLVCHRGEDSIVLIYDVALRAFVDASEIDALANGWSGADVQLRRTDYEFFPDGRYVGTFHDFRWTPGVGTLTTSEPPPLRSADERHELYFVDDGLEIGPAGGAKRVIAIEDPIAFETPWANTMFVDLTNDGRVFDAASGTWRYLTARGLGTPHCLSRQGRAAVFFDGDRITVGVAHELPRTVAVEVAWSEPDLRRVAIASALCGDFDEANVALQRMDDAAYAETMPLVDEIVAEHDPDPVGTNEGDE